MSADADPRMIVYCPPDLGFEFFQIVLDSCIYEFTLTTDLDCEEIEAWLQVRKDKKKKRKK